MNARTFLLLVPAFALAGCNHLNQGFQEQRPAAEPSIAVDPSKPNSPANTPDVVAANNIIAQIAAWKLGAVEIQNDLDGGVTIVRTNDTAGAPTGRIDDAQLVAAVRQRLESDGEVGRAKIDISAKHGEVALRGQADHAATIGRAIAIALSTPGVSKVSSDIKPAATVPPAVTRP